MARHPVAELIDRELTRQGKSQGWLGIEVARLEGRDNPYTQPAVSGWLDKIEDKHPSLVFHIEQALGRSPGSLSRRLGYLPVNAKPAETPEAALEADADIPKDVADVLIAAIRQARKRGV